MIRPATPLTVLLFVAFVFLLLSVISVPITKFVRLGEFNDITYGVFGFCKGSKCSSIGIGYKEDVLDNEHQAFKLVSGARRTLSSILVIHPVAALLTLILFGMAAASHLHSASHSSRYLLGMFVLSIITFLACVVAFVVDVLLFIPHMAWGSYIVLAATIMMLVSGVVIFAMRRTIVGRKARQKRIAENAEMSGENYYNREGQMKPDVATQPTFPVMAGGASATGDHLPTFATFESGRKDDQVSDERIPLTQRSPVDRTAMSDVGGMAQPRREPSLDRFGNPSNGMQDAYGMPRSQSTDRMNGRGRGGAPPRGGRGPPGRGGFDPYGPAGRGRGRGGYGPPPGRGGPRGRGGYGPPPRGYGPGGMRGRGPPGGGYANMPGGPYDRRPSADSHNVPYGQPGQSETSLNRGWDANNGQYGGEHDDLPRAESPPPLPGQVAEMGYDNIRDSDTDVAGMIGLQQGHGPARHDTIMSEGSKYSTDGQQQYLPPRTAWNQNSGRNSPRAASPASFRPMAAEPPVVREPHQRQGSRGEYYEDVAPRFSPPPEQPIDHDYSQQYGHQPQMLHPGYDEMHGAVEGGSRSPAESDRSNFTSISQRGVNPRWEQQPPMPQGRHYGRPPAGPAQAQKRQDMLLNSNPDFQLPGAGRAQAANRPGAGMIPGSAYPGAI